MSYSLTQSQHTHVTATVSSATLTFGGNTAIGNLLFFAGNSDHGGAPTITPSGLATWARIGTVQNEPGNNQDCTIWFGIATSAGTVVTITATGGTTNLAGSALAVVEIHSTAGFAGSPLGASDTTKAFAATGAGTDAETSNSITPTAADCVVCAFQDSANQASITAGTGWTTGVAELGQAGATGSCGIEFQSAAGGSQNGTFTVGTAGHQYTNQIAAFHPPGGGGAAQQTFFRLFGP